jgi:nucleotide-binding universal stress UspA family protein
MRLHHSGRDLTRSASPVVDAIAGMSLGSVASAVIDLAQVPVIIAK